MTALNRHRCLHNGKEKSRIKNLNYHSLVRAQKYADIVSVLHRNKTTDEVLNANERNADQRGSCIFIVEQNNRF
jgi:hypothetical protein